MMDFASHVTGLLYSQEKWRDKYFARWGCRMARETYCAVGTVTVFLGETAGAKRLTRVARTFVLKKVIETQPDGDKKYVIGIHMLDMK